MQQQQSSAVSAWWGDAACVGADLEWFFGAPAKRGRWRRCCPGCPVVEVCFWSAMVEEAEGEVPYRFGVRGGTTPGLRAQIAAVVGPKVPKIRLVEALGEWSNRRTLPASAGGSVRAAGF